MLSRTDPATQIRSHNTYGSPSAGDRNVKPLVVRLRLVTRKRKNIAVEPGEGQGSVRPRCPTGSSDISRILATRLDPHESRLVVIGAGIRFDQLL